MTRIDTVEWKKFPLRDLFDFKLPQEAGACLPDQYSLITKAMPS